jgi:hypothetical protein
MKSAGDSRPAQPIGTAGRLTARHQLDCPFLDPFQTVVLSASRVFMLSSTLAPKVSR